MPAAADYTLLEPMRPDRARIRFAGRFDGRAVVWNAEVIALQATQSARAAAFIHVGPSGVEGRALRVGLALQVLDTAALAKTVIMIRNYKRLRRGYMRFGESERHSVTKIISGGQTGVDRAALDAARGRGIATGGFCPKGRRAEDGTIPAHYHLTELPTREYPARTRRNVAAADGTLILTRGRLAGGSAYTAQVARRLGKPTLIVDLTHRPRIAAVHAWLALHRVQVLNVAGSRESKAPGIYQNAKRFLARLWPDGRG